MSKTQTKFFIMTFKVFDEAFFEKLTFVWMRRYKNLFEKTVCYKQKPSCAMSSFRWRMISESGSLARRGWRSCWYGISSWAICTCLCICLEDKKGKTLHQTKKIKTKVVVYFEHKKITQKNAKSRECWKRLVLFCFCFYCGGTPVGPSFLPALRTRLLWMCGITPPPAIVALMSWSNSSSPRIANCKWRGVIRFTLRSFEAFPANSRTSAVKYSRIAAA